MEPTPDHRRIGDYRLKELRAENETSRLWLAEQVSISRLVLLDELRPERTELRQAFIANMRAKAAVHHPMIGSVYEAADGDEALFRGLRMAGRRHTAGPSASRRAADSRTACPNPAQLVRSAVISSVRRSRDTAAGFASHSLRRS